MIVPVIGDHYEQVKPEQDDGRSFNEEEREIEWPPVMNGKGLLF